jgi:hypothetical protein
MNRTHNPFERIDLNLLRVFEAVRTAHTFPHAS